jgi:hypothetical protein
MLPDWIKLCNCCQCNKELVGTKCLAGRKAKDFYSLDLPERMAGRVNGRPFCQGCLLDFHRPPPSREA